MIDFRQLRGLMSNAFDTDNLLSVTDPMTQEKTAENVPCHFVITSADSPGGTIESEKVLPITVYGEIYTSETPKIRENYVVVIEKKDAAGNLIATYTGAAAMPAYRAGRMVTAVNITSIVSEEEPLPEDGGFTIYIPDGEGDRLMSADKYAIEIKSMPDGEGSTANYLFFTDVRFEIQDGALYLDDSGFGGRTKILPYTVMGYMQLTDGKVTYKVFTRQKLQIDSDTGKGYAEFE